MLALPGSWLRSGAITLAMLITLAGCGSDDPTGPGPDTETTDVHACPIPAI